MRRKFAVIVKMSGNTSNYDLDCIGNGLYKMWFGGNKKSTTDSILKQVNRLDFIGCKIDEVVDIIETN